MHKLYGARLHKGKNELPENFQNYLDKIISEGKEFKVEEYYNEVMTVIVDECGRVYLYRTKEINGKSDGYNELPVECTLSEPKDMEELYRIMVKMRVIREIDEIREIYKRIEEYVEDVRG